VFELIFWFTSGSGVKRSCSSTKPQQYHRRTAVEYGG